MAALITGGSFDQFGKTGDRPMTMVENRSGHQNEVKIIDYLA